ncbi:MAG: RagB/SusD family nutrient uptake outer membrane protein [Prolixibacteraceae bacterium]|nr:RagB/SusD family nutrient uptake outer membrane protein [Prolixibacteraceae bacterium]
MKKYINIFFAIVLSGFLFSCNEQLDLPSDGRITMDEVFSDLNRTKGYLNSCYGHCPAPYMDRSSFSDEAQDADDVTPGSRYSMWYNGSVTSSSYPSYSVDGSPWGSLYEGIRKCNVFIENMKTATVYATEEIKAGWVAQARTLRALYYLQLIKRYGGVPIFEKPLEIGYDFSKDKRATFSEVVTFILADCDAALAVPNTEDGFHWSIYDNQYGIMSRAVAYAIKSEAVTYAASPLWSDGTYTWAMATAINKEALAQCLANDYKLFDVTPASTIAQNAYALYFFTGSNDQRSVDKETIYHSGGQMQVWKYAGLPSNPGMEKAGPCPTQELVDSYEMANGQMPITGYSDANRLNPIINSASGYNPANPYEGRDPRFYASIYYNGAVRNLGQVTEERDDTYSLAFTGSTNQLDVTEVAPGSYSLTTTGGDPFVMLTALTKSLNNPPTVTFSFEYKSSDEINPQIFFGPALAEARSIKPVAVPKATEWSIYSIDITSNVKAFGWGNPGDNLRFDIGVNPGVTMQIKNIQIRVKSLPAGEVDGSSVQTYVGGKEEISDLNRKHTRTGYYLRKFNNFKSGQSNDADGAVRLFRLAELYLNFAESAYQSDGPDAVITSGSLSMSARDAVNAVRARVGMPALPTGMTKEAFEKRYRNERRIELAFEEHRFFDVRRWKILNETDKFVTGMEITKSGSAYTYTRFKFKDRNCSSDKYLMYPIDQDEVDKIIGLSGVNWQNPGWLD